MVNLKQLDRLVLKIVRLKDFYAEYLIESEEELSVLLDGKPISKGETWGEDFSYGNFTFTYSTAAKNPYLYVENGAVENLLKADGKPFGMTDYLPNGKDAIFRCHKFVSLKNIPQGAQITVEGYASHTFYGTMPFEKKQTFSVNGYRPERVYNKISIVDINPTVKAFLDNSELLVSYFRCMKEGDSRKIAAYRVYEELFEILTVLPHHRPNGEELARANAAMEAFFLSLKDCGEEKTPFAGVIGHSHLDTAWLWTVEESRHKAARTAANAVTLLKEYPQYRFIMSSAVYLDWLKKDYPELFEEIKTLVKEGRFEPNGGTWVECECNLTDGESIIRQFLRGKRFLKENFGYEADVFWLPDTFGYSAALPQILQGCRVPYFLTTKLSWNDTNKFPYESFVWQGIDGSEVLVHFNTIQSKADPEFVTQRLEKRMNKHLTQNVLIAYGYGDGGGGPTREMVEAGIKTEQTYPYAEVKHTAVSEFMARLAGERLPTYAGELYLELHRGTLTTNHEIKRLNRRLEGALKDAELLSVGWNDRSLKAVTDECYDTLMLNQFHDILPGTCIHEVHEKAIAENAAALERLNGLFAGDRYFNTLAFERKEALESATGVQSYLDLDGNEKRIALYEFAPYAFGKEIQPTGEFIVDGDWIVTPYYEAVVREGKIVSLKSGGRELAKGALNEICVYEDVPYLWDNWDVDADYRKKPCEVKVESSEIVACGALELRIRTVYLLAGKSRLTQDTVFYTFKKEIAFESKLDFCDEHKFIRAEFDTTLAASQYKSEIQFGYIERPTTRNTSEEQAKYEVCNHKWTDLSEPRFGLAILNDGKYGVSVEGGKMGLSLLKSGKRPDTVGEAGVKYFSYAILPHEGGFTAEAVTLPAYAFNRKPVKAGVPVSLPIQGVTAPNIVLETVKFAEDGDGIVLRLYECERSLTNCELTLNGEYEIFESDMLEENLRLLGKGRNLSLGFRQFEIKTLILKKIS
ncbi:MAG: alpha-mannosidase [Clostridia bacterium]|nr:alpha-mannosidase [Clostridia bacterium]